MAMPHKSSIDIVAVWIATGTANVIGYIAGWVEYLPIIREMIAIISIIIAIAYSLYKFKKDWSGWNPKKKK